MQQIYTTQHKRARGGQTNKQTPKNCRGHRKMIRQKHAKRKSQTECEIHGQIHKVNYGEQSRDKEKQRERGRKSN